MNKSFAATEALTTTPLCCPFFQKPIRRKTAEVILPALNAVSFSPANEQRAGVKDYLLHENGPGPGDEQRAGRKVKTANGPKNPAMSNWLEKLPTFPIRHWQ